MRIAYYAPLKSPDHPVPSGDRLMAGMLRTALQAAGHDVALVSELRSYCGDPQDGVRAQGIAQEARAEQQRIGDGWRDGVPDLWLSYHPYYKSPDLIGPPLCRAFGVPYLTIETSYSARRNIGVWQGSQAKVLEGINLAAVNICLTARDRAGIHAAAPKAQVAELPPFIDPAPFVNAKRAHDGPVRLITVAMMRAGDKFASYTLLAQALAEVAARDWQLTIVGAGQMEPEVRAMFAAFGRRVTWAGLCPPDRVAALLGQSDVYVWPGFGEAYGLAYLEAQAVGLPVVAQRVAGVPEVMTDETGILVPEGDIAAFAAAMAALIGQPARRDQMGAAAQARVQARHSMAAATLRLGQIVEAVVR